MGLTSLPLPPHRTPPHRTNQANARETQRIDMCCANYETGASCTSTLDRISARYLQAVVDGLTDGSSSARRACGRGGRTRMLCWEG